MVSQADCPHFGVLNYLCFILIFLIILKVLITYLNRFFHICESERFPKTKYNINKYKWLILLPKSDQTVTEKYWSNKTKPHWFSAPVFNFYMFLKSSWTSWNVYLQFSGCSCSSLRIYLQRFSREKSVQFISALFGGTPCIIEVGVAFTQHDWRVLGQRVLVLHHLIS